MLRKYEGVKCSLMQLNVVNAKYEPRVSRVLSMRVVDHVVVSVACVRKEGKLINTPAIRYNNILRSFSIYMSCMY